jgi:type II secretory pathway component PulF
MVTAMHASDEQRAHARFWRKYMRLTRAGIPVLKSLEIIAAEEKSGAWHDVAKELGGRLEAGVPLSEALAQSRRAFSLSTLELIRVAERRGAWDEVLEELAAGLEEGTFE